ncbi:Zn(2)-C6 fungal-type domain-containing protein [Fusarium keratoplasticum]|nr:Zn(2)-C6 fungal-type domain-containing protein [Fusarium keratoplasticum]
MLASPERRFLWQYFLSAAETDFLCLDWEDVGHLYAYQHPYITNLPYMALSNAALRGAIFCFSAAQYQLRFEREDFIVTKSVTCSEAVRSIEIQLSSTTRDESNLLSIVYAATLLYSFGPERRDYLRIASQLVIEFLAGWKPEANTSKSYPEITLTEYRWTVICTLCSLQKPNPALGDRICHMIEMGDYEVEQKYSNAFQSWVSHPIYTFSPRLVNPLLRIGRLLQSQLSQLDGGADHEPPPTWESRVAEAEEILLQARERDASVSESALDGADPVAVVALNESMYAASSILLYARIHVVDEISKIQPTSHVSYAIVFPLFVAGCEAVEPQVRDVVEQRLREPRGVSYNRGDVIGALHRIWEIRDLEPGLPWPHWVDKVEPRYRDICLM